MKKFLLTASMLIMGVVATFAQIQVVTLHLLEVFANFIVELTPMSISTSNFLLVCTH